MIKRRSILVITFVFGILLITACTVSGGSLEGTNWQLESYRDAGGEMTAVNNVWI